VIYHEFGHGLCNVYDLGPIRLWLNALSTYCEWIIPKNLNEPALLDALSCIYDAKREEDVHP